MAIAFPPPAVIAGRNFWRKGAIRQWLAAMAGEVAPAPQPDDEHMMTTRAVREMCGGVSVMWLHRRRKEAANAPDAA